jgi:acetyl esterase/lipase
MVYFHGGSWTEGKPDWFFGSGEYYAKQGWVAVAIEYRINARHGTSPFESVKDAKSAIRWLRVNARQYNIDPSKIVATGNSAGGHLAMASALADNWNEVTDDMNINASPDVLLVTSGVFDLTVDNTKWIVKGMENKEIVKEISPNHLLKSNLPPMLVIHGEKDKNCLYSTAEYFVDKSKTLGNDVELHTIKGARHFIWFGKYAGQVSKIKREYLERLELN